MVLAAGAARPCHIEDYDNMQQENFVVD